MEKDKFGFGDVVKHKIHGFEGVVIGITHWLHNCTRYTVQPQTLKADGDPRDSKSFDVTSLVLVSKAPEPQPRHESRSPVKLGDIARDAATDASGIVFAIYYDANGCTRYLLQARALHDGKVTDLASVDDLHAILVESNQPAAPAKVEPVKTGGPRAEPKSRCER